MSKFYFKEYFIICKKITNDIYQELFIVEDEKIAKHYCKNHSDVDYKVERIDYNENKEVEKMLKKKIKNLSEKELDCICKEKLYCSNCPLEINKGIDSLCIKGVLEHLKEFNDVLEEEVEVLEDGK